MSGTRPDRTKLLDLLAAPPAMTIESIAVRLREGPLRTMLTLQIRAGTLLAIAENDRQRLEKLVELMQLTRMAATQFEHFALELQSLIDGLTACQRHAPVEG
jgi:hypothetical protein